MDKTPKNNSQHSIINEISLISSLIEGLTNGMVLFDRSKNVVLTNPAITRMTGLPRESFDLAEFTRLFEKDHLDFETAIDQAMENREIIHIPERKLFRFFYEIFITPVINSEKEVVGGVIILHDISHYQREKELLESVGDGVVAIDRSFTITFFNKSAAAISGWPPQEVIGRPFREVIKFVREKDRKENIIFIEEAMLYGEQRSMENHTLLIRKDGTEISVGDSAAPVFDSSGKVIGAIIIFRDVSKERDAQKMKEEILSETIHDLRAPSNAIKFAAELYSDPEELAKDPDALKKGVEIIKEANARMLELINSLLEKARGETGAVKRDRVSLTDAISGIVKESGFTAERRGVKTTYLPPEKPPYVLANAGRLKEIFSNLIDNAIKYNKDGGTVTITHQTEGSLVRTTIQDTGIGMNEKDLSKLFTPYFRANDTEQIQGTGLGLFTTKKFVEEAGGNITVHSKIGEGTAFTVSLPLADK